MQQLPPVALGKRFRGFHLENRAAANQKIKVVWLAEALKLRLDQHLAPSGGNAKGRLALVNLLVKQSPKVALDIENVTHRLVHASLVLLIVHTTYLGSHVNRHDGPSGKGIWGKRR
jgi:hypothetical protein